MSSIAYSAENARVVDLACSSVRELNRALHRDDAALNWRVLNPNGKHALAVGLTGALNVDIEGHCGYYCAGMNQEASVTIHGNAGAGAAENMMSGLVRVTGNASHYAGASGHGGVLIIEGDASARCGISMKGLDIVVGGSAGHMSAFMAQSGRLLICGDAGSDLGDSIYEAVLYVQGTVKSLGADCVEKEMSRQHLDAVASLLKKSGLTADPGKFRRYGSARKLYHFDIDHADQY